MFNTEDVRVSNCVLWNSELGHALTVKVAFSQYSADCPVEYYRNNPARKKAEGAEWEKVVEAQRSSRRGAVRDVVLKNIQVIGAQTPLVEIRGWSKRNEIDGVRFENVTVGGKELRSLDELHLRATNATGISFAERQR